MNEFLLQWMDGFIRAFARLLGNSDVRSAQEMANENNGHFWHPLSEDDGITQLHSVFRADPTDNTIVIEFVRAQLRVTMVREKDSMDRGISALSKREVVNVEDVHAREISSTGMAMRIPPVHLRGRQRS
jgi:hypothetical protein